MSKPCAVFWDIHNISLPKGRSAGFIVNQIRSIIIKPYKLIETFFFCICDLHKLSSKVGRSLADLKVEIIHSYTGIKAPSDCKKVNLIKRFVKYVDQDCAIILLSGSTDYYNVLCELKKLYNIQLHLIRLVNSYSIKLESISDYTYLLDNGILKAIRSTGLPMYFISIMDYPLTMNINQVMKSLNGQAVSSIPNSALLYGNNLIYIAFSNLYNAEKAIETMNRSRFHGLFLKVEFVVDSPLTEIIKCIKPHLDVPTRNTKQVKQLTFIKIINENKAIKVRQVISFCIICMDQTRSRCILSKDSDVWIVFLFKSDAEKCLLKIRMLFPDSIISDPPNDLTSSSYYHNPYTVEPCEQKTADIESLDYRFNDSSKGNLEAGAASSSQNSSFNSLYYLDGFINTSRRSEDSLEILSPNSSRQNVDDESDESETRLNNDWKLFFRLNHSVSNDNQLTKWTLLYNLFEQLYELGVKKVMYDGLYYCAHFESVTRCLVAFAQMRLRYLDPLEFVLAPEAHKIEVSKKMERYVQPIPWCLNEELDLYCLVIKMDTHYHDCFIQMRKKILGNLECIFIKSIPDTIWIGFPDESICKSSEKSLGFIDRLKKSNEIFTTKPSNSLLETITFYDLVGDAYDLAFLSNQLETPQPIIKPSIIERISLERMEPQNLTEPVYHISVKGYFVNKKAWARLSFEQIVKILVKFSKVIPIAATASYIEINLMYNSWYEAHAARHFINKLTLPEVPYFEELKGASEVKKDKDKWAEFSEFYIINDKRKVLDKIVQNQSSIDNSVSSPSSTESRFDIEQEDGEMMRQIEFFYTISTNSDFKFTSGMISLVKMILIQMDCPVFVVFKDKIWVGIDDYVRASMAKIRIDQIKFKFYMKMMKMILKLKYQCQQFQNVQR